MPHVIVEYSNDIAKQCNIQELVESAVAGAIDSGLFSASAIKGRAHEIEFYWTGGGESPFCVC